jgi:hypothetical protein
MEIPMLKSLALLMCCLVYIAINGTSTVNQANLTSPTESLSPVSLNTATLPMGAWGTGYYLDEVGDQTSSGYVSLTTIGTFSNPVSTGSALTAKMFVDAGSRTPWFRLYEHPNNQPVTGVYSDSINTLDCQVKQDGGEPLPVQFYQREGADNFWLDRRGRSDLVFALSRESEIQVVCHHSEYPSTTYRFVMDFGHFKQAMAEVEGQNL